MTNGRTYNGRFGASGAVRCRKIGTIFVGNFLVGMELKPRLRQAAGTLSTQ